MPISFNNIPANWKQPLYWVEIDGSMAGYPQSHMRSLLVGSMIASLQHVTTAAVAAGGTGYVANDTVQLANNVHLTVTTVSAGAITAVSITNGGSIPASATPPARRSWRMFRFRPDTAKSNA